MARDFLQKVDPCLGIVIAISEPFIRASFTLHINANTYFARGKFEN